MTTHGHIIANEDGYQAPCGGPTTCEDCAKEFGMYGLREFFRMRDENQALRDVLSFYANPDNYSASTIPIGKRKSLVMLDQGERATRGLIKR